MPLYEAISDHLQSRWYEDGPWKGPSNLVALARSLVADSVWLAFDSLARNGRTFSILTGRAGGLLRIPSPLIFLKMATIFALYGIFSVTKM